MSAASSPACSSPARCSAGASGGVEPPPHSEEGLQAQQSPRQQHRDAHVDAAAFPAFRRDEILDRVQRHAVDDDVLAVDPAAGADRSEEHTSELQSLMRISYAVFCLKKNKTNTLMTYTHKHSI